MAPEPIIPLSNGGDGLSGGAIAGIVVSCMFVVIAAAVGSVLWYKLYWKRRHYYSTLE